MTGSRVLCRFLSLGVAGAALVFTATSVRGQGPATLETIAKAWNARQESIHSARITWTESETVPKGYITNEIGRSPDAQIVLQSMGIPPGSVVPPEDTTFAVPCSLVLDGEKLRYSREGRQWSAKVRGYVPEPILKVFDGNVGKTYNSVGAPYTPVPQGVIQKASPMARYPLLAPLFMTLRPLHPEMNTCDLTSMSITGRRADVDGRSCVELEIRKRAVVERLWLDPTRDWVVVRYVELEHERNRSRIDVKYRRDGKYGWLPDGWFIGRFAANGSLISSIRAKVHSCDVNMGTERREFGIDFPPGTRVSDVRDPKSRLEYITKEGNAKRIILPEDLGATYEQMINSEPGEALGKKKPFFLSWSTGVMGAVLVVASAILLWRCSRNRRSPA